MVRNKPVKEPAIIKQPVGQVHELADSIVNTVREPLIMLDQDLRVITVSRSFYEVFKVKPEETVGQLIYDLGNKQWDIPRLRELLENILLQKATFDDYEVEHDFATIGRRIMLLNARQIQGVLGKERGILLAIEDITERKEIEKKLIESETRYRTLIEAASDQIFVIDSEMKILSVNSSAAKLLHKKPQDMIGKSQTEIFPDQIATDTKRNVEEVFKTGMPVMKEDILVFGDQKMLCNTSLSPLKDLSGNVIAVIGIAKTSPKLSRRGRRYAIVNTACAHWCKLSLT